MVEVASREEPVKRLLFVYPDFTVEEDYLQPSVSRGVYYEIIVNEGERQMDGAQMYLVCLEQATAIVKQVRAEQFAAETPDSEWNVRDLLEHMLNELSWVPDILEGKTIAEVGDKYDEDLVGENDSDLSTNWQSAVDRAAAAVERAELSETAHLSYGHVTIEEYLRQAGSDQLIHAWDLGQAIRVPVRFNFELAQIVYAYSLPHESMLRSSGLFGRAVDTAADADVQTKLLGLYGRRANWEPSQ